MMQRLLTYPPAAPSDLETDPSFNVVAAYEDVESGKHAKETYDFVVASLGPDCRPANRMWKFEVLDIPQLRELAAEDAAMADLIIISCRGQAELPAGVKAWIDLWLAEKGNVIALAALFGPPTAQATQAPAIRAYLAGVARSGRMQFFAQPDEWPGKREQQSQFGAHRASALDEEAFSMLPGEAQPERSFPRWGINE
jgi:hypothetical protein